MNDTQPKFQKIFEAMKNEANYYRLRSVYCYDVTQHPEFNKVEKAINKLRKLTGAKAISAS